MTACAVASLLTLSACGAGPNAQTAKFYSPGDGVNGVVPPMKVLNALVVAPGEGGGEAVISMMIANESTEPETVTDVITDRSGPARLSGQKTIAARGAVMYGTTASQAQALLPGFTGKPGETVTISVRFARNRAVEGLKTVVLPPTGYYGDLKVQPAPSAVPTAPVNPPGSPPVTEPAAPAGTGGGELPDDPADP